MFEHGPAALLFVAGGIRAGLTLEQALDLLEREAPEPLRSQFVSHRGAMRGGTFSDRVERLLPGPDLVLARATLLLSQQVGGQAASLLEQCAENLQMKLELEHRLQALTAQGRGSAWMVGLTPVFLLAGYAVWAWDMVAPLFQSVRGGMVLSVALIMIAVGIWMVHRLARLE